MKSLHTAFVAAFALVVAVPSAATAQREVALDRFEPALDRHGFLGVQGTPMPGHLHVDAALWLSWTENLLELRRSDGPDIAVIDHRLRSDAIVQLGLGDRFAAALDVPMAWYQSGDGPALDGGGDLPAVAAGDPRLVLRARLIGEEAKAGRDERAEGFGLAATGSLTAPIGADNAFTAEASAVTNLGLLADFRVLGLGVGVSLGWKHRFEHEQIGLIELRDELHYGVGLEVPIPVTKGLSGLLEVRGWTDARSPFGDVPRSGVEGDLGVRWRRGDVSLTAAVGRGFNAALGTPAVRGLVGVMWSPRVHDADGDGIPDHLDECPHLPEDFDGFEDDDGCLDPDNDGDLVPDEDDRCPNEPAIEGRDEDFDGCTDPVRDSDGDGIEDRDDQCPHRAEDADGFEDEDGCPDPDNDGDGVPDAQD
ncbi:MAG: thrombospondin type 3 repeat-containing protein, partial [Myxococcota bacterium]